MPSKVILRGFGPQLPENLSVTFCDQLPQEDLCAQCDNVSAVLHKDPTGHGYCPSCMKMNTNQDSFECAGCDENFSVSKLIIDRSIRNRIKNMTVFCPNGTQKIPVRIPFSALKAHLKGCSCNQIADSPTDSHQPPPFSTSSRPLCPCPKCQGRFLKRDVAEHVKNCKGLQKPNPVERQQTEVDPPSVAGQPPELSIDSYTDVLSVEGDQEKHRQCSMAQEAMADLKKSVASSLSTFKDECDRLRGDVDQLSSSITQAIQDFLDKFEKIQRIMFPHGQEQDELIIGQP